MRSDHLKLVIEKYRRMIVGRKSEKLTRELEQLELRLEELETMQLADQAAEAAAVLSKLASGRSTTLPYSQASSDRNLTFISIEPRQILSGLLLRKPSGDTQQFG